jgi:hypothetical protein
MQIAGSTWSMGNDIQQSRGHFKGIAYANYAAGIWTLQHIENEAKKLGGSSFAVEVLNFLGQGAKTKLTISDPKNWRSQTKFGRNSGPSKATDTPFIPKKLALLERNALRDPLTRHDEEHSYRVVRGSLRHRERQSRPV